MEINQNPLTNLQSEVINILSNRYKDKPIIGAELWRQVAHLSLKNDNPFKPGANLRSVINTLRDKGYAICANKDGYYVPKDPQELEEYINSFQARIDSQQNACDVLKDRHKNWVEILERESRNEQRLF